MDTLSGNRMLRLQLGRQARERAINVFSGEKLSAAWLDFYRARL